MYKINRSWVRVRMPDFITTLIIPPPPSFFDSDNRDDGDYESIKAY